MAHEAEPIISAFADDPEMADLVELFTEELPKRIESIESAFESQSWDSLRTIAHQLKGAAPSYGFDSIGQAAGTVEHGVKDGSDAESLRGDVEALLSLCRRAAAGSGGNG